MRVARGVRREVADVTARRILLLVTTVILVGTAILVAGKRVHAGPTSVGTVANAVDHAAQSAQIDDEASVIYIPVIYHRYPNPTSPTSPYPPENARDISVNTFLAWTSSSLDDLDLRYEIYLEANDSSPDERIGSNIYDNFGPDPLDMGTQYYWQVIAIDEEGRRTAGPVWTFKTQEEEFTPNVDEMITIPAGGFAMGCSNADQASYQCSYNIYHYDEPQRIVYLDGYRIDRYEVTNQEYRACVDADACDPPQKTKSSTRDSYYDNPDFDLYPVMYVSWQNAVDFCAWEGKRLPTEAEWEKAARGPVDARLWPWGYDNVRCELANVAYQVEDACQLNIRDTKRVGSYVRGASPYGLMDVSGNLFEWVHDLYDVLYYTYAPLSNPTGPVISRVTRDFEFANQLPYPVYSIRGGSWRDPKFYANVIHRHWGHHGDGPKEDAPLFRSDRVGFRCAVDVR